MKNLFSFNYDTFNYWPIYDAVKKYYPLGIDVNRQDVRITKRSETFVDNYPANKDIQELIHENIFIQKNHSTRWGSFQKDLQNQTAKRIRNTSNLMWPCFSGNVVLSNKKNGNCIYSSELRFAVSLLGPFYTIYGADSTTLVLHSGIPHPDEPTYPVRFPSINAITASPYQEYESTFQIVQDSIRKCFPGYRLVPFVINTMRIEGLHLDHFEEQDPTIHDALFYNLENFTYSMRRVRGDKSYGCDEWRI
ncbi:hypothetical protein F0P96_20380 [Hymenobacter busanensis]|uniref:Uncharacterized protein n=1 Tax=Hymenobacter busanensis TaxID=2607656 RepID=A0A7L4ZX88_9BACT|nr:hypothetical protein [Hymenobacter busanensis]KAA9325360.1 hypothetical protein F0P96_20380 [Hymenobacter busanensis]QHJ07647.1 hypothetical protein GUY19_10255 [Hymenobacter busanensis]